MLPFTITNAGYVSNGTIDGAGNASTHSRQTLIPSYVR